MDESGTGSGVCIHQKGFIIGGGETFNAKDAEVDVTAKVQPLVRCFEGGKLRQSFDAGYILWQVARALVRLSEIQSQGPAVYDPYHGINSLFLEKITLHKAGHCTVDIGT